MTAQAPQARAAYAMAVGESDVLGRAFEAAVLVEEANIEVQDAIADHVEPEVARLDHAGMDRADRDLVGVGAVDGHGPGCEVAWVVDERAQRFVAVEAHAVQIVGLALGPLRGRADVDEARHAAVVDDDADAVERAVGPAEHGADDGPAGVGAGIQAGEAAARGERVGDGIAVACVASVSQLMRALA